MKRLLMFVLPLLAALASTASAARVPDAHDRALMAQLEAKVAEYHTVGKSTSVDHSLEKCSFVKGDVSKAFAATIAALPAIVAQLVHRYRAAFDDIEQTLASMRPDDAVFRRWVAAMHDDVAFLIRFDNGGKKIDLCRAADAVLHNRVSEFSQVLGLPASLVKRFLTRELGGQGAALKRLDTEMRPFLIAGGVSPEHAGEMTDD
jgi:hypothetical protein